MGADDCSKGRFPTQKMKGCVASPVWKEELLAKAVAMDGRKQRYCRTCSATRSKCRRCQTDTHASCVDKGRSWSESSSSDGEDQVLV